MGTKISGRKQGRTIAIGLQDFGDLIRKGYFYVDKTDFIREWWESGDSVTLIARPRRFGKTLNMSMLEYFFPQCMPDRARCLRGFLYGSMQSTVLCREPIRLSASPLPM